MMKETAVHSHRCFFFAVVEKTLRKLLTRDRGFTQLCAGVTMTKFQQGAVPLIGMRGLL